MNSKKRKNKHFFKPYPQRIPAVFIAGPFINGHIYDIIHWTEKNG